MLTIHSLPATQGASRSPPPGNEALGCWQRRRLTLRAASMVSIYAVSIFVLSILGAALTSPLAQAQEALWEQHLAPSDLVPNQLAPVNTRNVSVERAIRIVRRETGGRVLAASAGKRKGHAGVNVRTLLDGERVTTFFVHADGSLQKR